MCLLRSRGGKEGCRCSEARARTGRRTSGRRAPCDMPVMPCSTSAASTRTACRGKDKGNRDGWKGRSACRPRACLTLGPIGPVVLAGWCKGGNDEEGGDDDDGVDEETAKGSERVCLVLHGSKHLYGVGHGRQRNPGTAPACLTCVMVGAGGEVLWCCLPAACFDFFVIRE